MLARPPHARWRPVEDDCEPWRCFACSARNWHWRCACRLCAEATCQAVRIDSGDLSEAEKDEQEKAAAEAAEAAEKAEEERLAAEQTEKEEAAT